jgi:hypothetical protein
MFSRLRSRFREWRDALSVERERKRVAHLHERERAGYEMACATLDTGEYTPDALYALTEGVFESSEAVRAFDRGVRSALHERGHKHPADPF